jgi:hypothetical protein
VTGFDPHTELTYAPARPPGNGMAVASLVLGIVSIVLFCIWYIGLPSAILAIVFGVVGRGRAKIGAGGGGMATAGLILGCVSIGIIVLFVAGALAFLGFAGTHMAGALQQAAQQAAQQAQSQPTTLPVTPPG